MKSFLQTNKFIYMLLIIVILAGICRFGYGFFVQKQGTHSDEEWSFGLANSYYEPYIYVSDDNSQYKNNNEWLSGSVLKDYLTVQEDERFSFGSVYYNMSCDTHPPLYFWVLHFLSSFFVDQYVPALAYVINMVCYVFMSIYLYRLAVLMCRSKLGGIFAVLFNTFTVGTLGNMIYMRNYAMLAMFAVIFAYMVARLYYVPDSRRKKLSYVSLGIVTCMGALTHHFFLPYAFIIAAVMCLYQAVKKNWHTLILYAVCMIAGVGISIAVFPATLDHMFGINTFETRDAGVYESDDDSESDDTGSFSVSETVTDESAAKADDTDDSESYQWNPYRYYFLICLQYMFKDVFAFSPISPNGEKYTVYIPVVILSLIILILPCIAAAFLFKREWLINLKGRLIKRMRKLLHICKNAVKKVNYFIIALILSVILIAALCSYKVDVMAMSDFTTRYLFIVYPIFNVLIFYLLFRLTRIIRFKNKRYIGSAVLFVLITAILVINNLFCECKYLWNSTEDAQLCDNNMSLLSEISNDSDIIIVSGSNWYLTVYSPELIDCNLFYFTTYADMGDIAEIEKNTSDKELYVIIELLNEDMGSVYSESAESDELYTDDVKNIMKSLSNASMFEHVGDTLDFGIYMEIYRLR